MFGRRKKQRDQAIDLASRPEEASYIAAQIMALVLEGYPKGLVIRPHVVLSLADTYILDFLNTAIPSGMSPADAADFTTFAKEVARRLADAYGPGGELEGTVNDGRSQ